MSAARRARRIRTAAGLNKSSDARTASRFASTPKKLRAISNPVLSAAILARLFLAGLFLGVALRAVAGKIAHKLLADGQFEPIDRLLRPIVRLHSDLLAKWRNRPQMGKAFALQSFFSSLRVINGSAPSYGVKRPAARPRAEDPRRNTPAIERWFRLEWQEHTPPFYCSVDLRNAGFKLAPVDTNLFPGAFNNLPQSKCCRSPCRRRWPRLRKICPGRQESAGDSGAAHA